MRRHDHAWAVRVLEQAAEQDAKRQRTRVRLVVLVMLVSFVALLSAGVTLFGAVVVAGVAGVLVSRIGAAR
jgi:hypothetical protein